MPEKTDAAIAPPGQEGWREAPGWWIKKVVFLEQVGEIRFSNGDVVAIGGGPKF